MSLNVKNITLKLKNITLCLSILILSSINIINTFTYIPNVSALDYSSNVGIGFTFNPTLSINISPSDLIIDNLIPGSTLDSNSINVSVTTNAAYGYTLSAIMDGDNSNLTHSNSIDTFNSIDPSANLETLTVDNTWGYTSKLSSETAWSNYNGLSSSINTILLDTNTNSSSNNSDSDNDSNNGSNNIDSIDFKIAAKASNTQPSGVYTGTINFYAITKPTPMNLAESYFAHGKTRHNGYYTMQDMTTEICNDTEIIGEGSQTELIDIRDNKVYWATKLADNHCWMTQNLDLDLSHDRPLTSEDTDLNDGSLSGAYAENYIYDPETKIVTWTPAISAETINFSGEHGTVVLGWSSSNTLPVSANKIDNTGIGHGSFGNYYNWTAVIASNNSSSVIENTYSDITNNPNNSICSKGWRLPTISNMASSHEGSTNEFGRLNYIYNNNATYQVEKIFQAPLYFAQPGLINAFSEYRIDGNEPNNYWSSTINTDISAYYLAFSSSSINPNRTYSNSRSRGASVRCVAR